MSPHTSSEIINPKAGVAAGVVIGDGYEVGYVFNFDFDDGGDYAMDAMDRLAWQALRWSMEQSVIIVDDLQLSLVVTSH